MKTPKIRPNPSQPSNVIVPDGASIGGSLTAIVGAAVRVTAVADGAGPDGFGVVAFVGAGDTTPPAATGAQTREPSTPGALPQTDCSADNHALPSLAVRESDTRTKG